MYEKTDTEKKYKTGKIVSTLLLLMIEALGFVIMFSMKDDKFRFYLFCVISVIAIVYSLFILIGTVLKDAQMKKNLAAIAKTIEDSSIIEKAVDKIKK